MNFIPEIRLSLINGIIPFGIYLVVFVITIFSFPKKHRLRLYDRTSWTREQMIYTLISKIFALFDIILIIFSAITNKPYLLIIGTILFICGISVMVSALITFCKSPLNNPITKGLYKYSRNPQMLGIWTVFFSIGIMTDSIISIMLLIMNIIFSHQYIKAEEQSCIRKYGDEYIEYLKSKPRYF